MNTINTMNLQVDQAKLNDLKQCQAIINIIQSYLNDDMGEQRCLCKQEEDQLIFQLRHHPRAIIFLASAAESYCGLLIAYLNISTFKALPMLNIHDVAVLPAYRGKGIGRALLVKAQDFAWHKGCCKMTLEVRCDNRAALSFYHSEGFHEAKPPMHFWVKALPV